MFNDIKEAFLGGYVDVYKPYGEKVKSYDVNSLYPNSMCKYPLPIGKPTYFIGEKPEKYIGRVFGFVYVNVYAPLDLKAQILPFRTRNLHGTPSTICGVGT
jgi:hypothetical protein